MFFKFKIFTKSTMFPSFTFIRDTPSTTSKNNFDGSKLNKRTFFNSSNSLNFNNTIVIFLIKSFSNNMIRIILIRTTRNITMFYSNSIMTLFTTSNKNIRPYTMMKRINIMTNNNFKRNRKTSSSNRISITYFFTILNMIWTTFMNTNFNIFKRNNNSPSLFRITLLWIRKLRNFNISSKFSIIIGFFSRFNKTTIRSISMFFTFKMTRTRRILTFFSISSRRFIIVSRRFKTRNKSSTYCKIYPKNIPSKMIRMPISSNFSISSNKKRNNTIITFRINNYCIRIFNVTSRKRRNSKNKFRFTLYTFSNSNNNNFTINKQRMKSTTGIKMKMSLINSNSLLLYILTMLFVRNLNKNNRNVCRFTIILRRSSITSKSNLSFNTIRTNNSILTPFFVFKRSINNNYNFNMANYRLKCMTLKKYRNRRLFFTSSLIPSTRITSNTFRIITRKLIRRIYWKRNSKKISKNITLRITIRPRFRNIL